MNSVQQAGSKASTTKTAAQDATPLPAAATPAPAPAATKTKTTATPKAAAKQPPPAAATAESSKVEHAPAKPAPDVNRDKPAKPGKASKTSPSGKTDQSERPKKIKLVRDSYTMPETEHALLATLKKRCLSKGLTVKKSELLRAAIIAFAALEDPKLITAMERLEILKTGRPAKG